MSKKLKKLFFVTILTAGFIFSESIWAATGVTINNFNLSPNVVPTTTSTGTTQFQMTLRLTVNVAEFNISCGSNNNNLDWYVYAGAGIKKTSGSTTINRTSSSLSLNLDEPITVPVSAPEFRGGTFDYYAIIYCPKSGFDTKLTESSKLKITFGTGSTTDKVWACIAADNKYACSPANLSNVSDVPVCTGRQPIQIGKNLCGLSTGSGGGTICGNNICEINETQVGCPNDCKTTTPGSTQTYPFEIPNPLKGGVTDFASLVKILAQWIFNLAIPIAVAMIVYAGILFLTSSGEPAKITKAKQVLTYAVIGLAIILIGSGFVTLIQSILELGGTGTTQNQGPELPVFGPQQLTSVGGVGSTCSKPRDCFTGLTCNAICQRSNGNLAGEPCQGGRNCTQGLGCDGSGANVQVIDGQNRGTCR